MRAIPQEVEERIDQFKKWLFHGDQIRIAKSVKVDSNYVSRVMNKRAFNKDVIEKAREVAIENARSMGVELQ